jgi:hypothetical protein
MVRKGNEDVLGVWQLARCAAQRGADNSGMVPQIARARGIRRLQALQPEWTWVPRRQSPGRSALR